MNLETFGFKEDYYRKPTSFCEGNLVHGEMNYKPSIPFESEPHATRGNPVDLPFRVAVSSANPERIPEGAAKMIANHPGPYPVAPMIDSFHPSQIGNQAYINVPPAQNPYIYNNGIYGRQIDLYQTPQPYQMPQPYHSPSLVYQEQPKVHSWENIDDGMSATEDKIRQKSNETIKKKPDSAIGIYRDTSTVYPIVRRPMKVSFPGSNEASSGDRPQHINLKILGTVLIEEINQVPWTDFETMDGRRIIRVDKTQEGNIVKAYFLIVNPHVSVNPNYVTPGLEYVEVSCIKYVHKDGITTEFLITSVEVIQIIEYLVGSNHTNIPLRRQERGRMRSNLASLWHKNCSSTSSRYAREMHQRLGRQILKYKSRKPYGILKDMRILLWNNLSFALYKALLFYCVAIPDENVKQELSEPS